MAKCSDCGRDSSSFAKYCYNCGSKLVKEESGSNSGREYLETDSHPGEVWDEWSKSWVRSSGTRPPGNGGQGGHGYMGGYGYP